MTCDRSADWRPLPSAARAAGAKKTIRVGDKDFEVPPGIGVRSMSRVLGPPVTVVYAQAHAYAAGAPLFRSKNYVTWDAPRGVTGGLVLVGRQAICLNAGAHSMTLAYAAWASFSSRCSSAPAKQTRCLGHTAPSIEHTGTLVNRRAAVPVT